jgi:glycosyltransferase involved in cell wall biosynthesis
MNRTPFVSVIVPFFNAERSIKALAESLVRLEYPKTSLEIICIDNNSRDNTKEILKAYPFRLLEETRVQSSYDARNRGIESARGEILAFTDSDCIVSPRWLIEGIQALQNGADMAGGEVEFFFLGEASFAQHYDTVMGMRNEYYIATFKTAVTANLFTKAAIFKKIGLFPSGAVSGGDVRWTSKATKAGFSLVFAPRAIVRHPARHALDLIAKHFRVGGGLIKNWRQYGISETKIAFLIFRLLLLWNPSVLRMSRNLRRRKERSIVLFLALWSIDYVCSLAKLAGICFTKKRLI